MARTDEQIKKDIVDHLYWDGRVDASNVKVEVSGGEVVLKGKVSNFISRESAEDDAWSIPEVLGVDNQLVIEYPDRITIPSDDEIKTNIESIFLWNPYLDEANIQVSAEDGIVKLEGSVDSYWKKVRSEDIVQNMLGVIEVVNELAVVPEKDVWDQVIAEDIIEAFKRNMYVDPEALNIEVEEGNVTISGGVSHWVAYRAAIDIVRNTAGVRNIVNNLYIKK